MKSKHKNNTNSIFISLGFFFSLFSFFFFSLVNNSVDALRSCSLIRLRFVLPYCASHYIFTVGYEDSVKSLNAHAEYAAHVSGVIILESAEREESDVFSHAARARTSLWVGGRKFDLHKERDRDNIDSDLHQMERKEHPKPSLLHITPVMCSEPCDWFLVWYWNKQQQMLWKKTAV